MNQITECPCCGWQGYKDGVPQDHDEAILACEWCMSDGDGAEEPCTDAQEILNKRSEEGA